MRSSLAENQIDVEGQTIRFNLFGETSFFYIVTTPTTEGDYVFSGLVSRTATATARAVYRTHTGASRPAANTDSDPVPDNDTDADPNSDGHARTDSYAYGNAYAHTTSNCNANA